MDFPDGSVSGSTEGCIANIDRLGRLAIPIGLLRALPWWKDATRDVLVELLCPGLVRLFGTDNANLSIAEHRSAYEPDLAEQALDFEQVLADRYRLLKAYSDGRVTLTREVAFLLGIPQKEPTTLFVQSFNSGLSIMSLEFRSRRLADHNQFPPMPLDVLQTFR